jgi:sugar phosphate isomerase/epimerase
MFDSHNAEDETEPHGALIEKYSPLIRHVHVNEMDGRHPGAGDYDFAAIFRSLIRMTYNRWISVEAFDFSAGADRIASETIDYLRKQETIARQ